MGKLVLLDYKINDITTVCIEINISRIYLKTPKRCPLTDTELNTVSMVILWPTLLVTPLKSH